jgi:ribonucleoside-diphosphate reductase alpha chain
MMEFISYHAILASSELAKEKGTYQSYKGSKWDRGIFPVDTLKILEDERGMETGVSKTGKMDWKPVYEHVKKYGMRNSNCMAIAPTATIANISGCLPSIEPIYKNLYVKSNFSGEFTVVNGALITDLKKENLWSREMLDKIKYFDGSIAQIDEIPEKIRAKYKETFEIAPEWVIKHAAHRGKWIDQSQSINLFISSESGKLISDAYQTAWKAGLKTTYYLRTLGASSIEKSTLDINKKFKASAAAPAD